MSLINKIIGKNKKNEKPNTILDKLDQAGIIYYDEETDKGYYIEYSDAFENVIYKIKEKDDSYLVNGKKMKESELIQLLKKQSKLDEKINELSDIPEYELIFKIYSFFNNLISVSGLHSEIIFEVNNTMYLLYSLKEKPQLNSFISGIKIEEKEPYEIINVKTNKLIKNEDVVLEILNDLYEAVPLFFNSENYKVEPNTEFTDAVKVYLLNAALVERLNGIEDVEAKILYSNGNSIIFVILKNGSALEYISPTKQSPQGKILIMDIDEDTTLEDNEEYSIVKKVLKLPEYLNDKPDESKIPLRLK